jgi:hypothetical protein
VKREDAIELFRIGWQMYQRKQLEELLVPVGRSLAWTYCLDGRDEDAIALLNQTWRAGQRWLTSNVVPVAIFGIKYEDGRICENGSP